MAIRGPYAQAILNGTKLVELRKRPLAEDVTHVLIYQTAPVSAVVGAFEVTGQDTGTAATIWDRHQHHAGIGKPAFDAYYRTPDAPAVAIGVGHATRLPAPVPLGDLPGAPRPPQSFAYLPPDTLTRLLPGRGPTR